MQQVSNICWERGIMKQAYIIIAHNKFEQLKFLISLLDYKKHDIFLVIDSKVSLEESAINSLKSSANFSKVILVDRVPIFWGSYSQIFAEFQGFRCAYNHDNYSMFHLLSGVDLPLEQAENLFNFFEQHKFNNFLSMVSDDIYESNKVYERVRFKYLCPNYLTRNIGNKFIRKFVSYYRKIELKVQRLLNVDCFKKYSMKLGYASNWVSINQELVRILIQEEKNVEKIFKNSIVNDELFIPTIMYKHNLMGTLYSSSPITDEPDDFQGNLRYINWWDGDPYTWTDSESDLEQLKRGKELGHKFSRKFDLDKYPNLKKEILTIINGTG